MMMKNPRIDKRLWVMAIYLIKKMIERTPFLEVFKKIDQEN
jgi:hypothetical protein